MNEASETKCAAKNSSAKEDLAELKKKLTDLTKENETKIEAKTEEFKKKLIECF